MVKFLGLPKANFGQALAQKLCPLRQGIGAGDFSNFSGSKNFAEVGVNQSCFDRTLRFHLTRLLCLLPVCIDPAFFNEIVTHCCNSHTAISDESGGLQHPSLWATQALAAYYNNSNAELYNFLQRDLGWEDLSQLHF